ncbi:hypothetical protein FOCC_FOCC002425 [Frankliniella occidentalis]|nr:hypothetical protein FOCC_FOCC002425 [Frankliniella occidentalis]
MFSDIYNNRLFPAKHKITKSSSKDNRYTKPHIKCHKYKHQKNKYSRKYFRPSYNADNIMIPRQEANNVVGLVVFQQSNKIVSLNPK